MVIAAYADPKSPDSTLARKITKDQSEAVCTYLKDHADAQKLGWWWFSSRKVTPLGLGTSPPPAPEKDRLPPARVEVMVFVPQN